MYSVKVKVDHRWSSAQVAGRIFSKHEAVTLNELAINDEILNSPLLDVEEIVDTSLEIDATESAIELAADWGVDLADVTGTGKDGRILLDDVRDYAEVAHDPQS